MSVQAMTWAFAQDIPPKPKIVLLALANRADPQTGKCWPSLERVSQETSVPERTLIRHIHALVRNGYVIRDKSRGPGGMQRNNTYYMVMDRDAARYGEWQFAGSTVDEDGDPDVGVDDADAQDDVLPTAMVAPGETVEKSPPPTATSGSSPTAIGGSHQPSSKTKPSLTQIQTRTPSGFSREAQNADIDRTQLQRLAEKSVARVFVFKDGEPWKAWCEYRRRHGQIPSLPETWTEIEGKRRCGWWMPTLYPPPDEPATGPPMTKTA